MFINIDPEYDNVEYDRSTMTKFASDVDAATLWLLAITTEKESPLLFGQEEVIKQVLPYFCQGTRSY